MTINNVSSNYLATAMLPSVKQAQSQLATLQTESATGQYADLGLQLGAQSGYEMSLRTQDDLLQTLTTANSLTSTKLTTTQNALTSILSSADDSLKSLVTSTSAGSAATAQSIGDDQLQQLIGLANTQSGDDYVFGGQNSGKAPLDDYFATAGSTAKTAIDSAFQTYFGFPITSSQVSTITSTQLQGFLNGPFAQQFSGANWTSHWSNASDDNVTTQIAPTTTVTTSSNANTDGFRDLAEGYTMLTAFGNIGLSAGAQQTLVNTATKTVNQGVSGIIAVQAQLGQSQNAITDANAQMSNQMTLMQKQIGQLDSVDPTVVATELTQITTQLETSYQVTSQLHNLNLAQYLPT